MVLLISNEVKSDRIYETSLYHSSNLKEVLRDILELAVVD